MMKKILFVAVMVTICVGCATSEAARQARAERQVKEAEAVKKGIEAKDFKINVNYVYPVGASPMQLSTPYYLKVKGDTVTSYLPYFGRAYSVPYGGGKALNFDGRILRYAAEQVKSDRMVVRMDIVNDETEYVYTVDIFDNGSSTIDVVSHSRETIRFSGNMEMTE